MNIFNQTLSVTHFLILIFRLINGGGVVESLTGCGKVLGKVDGHNMYSFRGIPYSVQVYN